MAARTRGVFPPKARAILAGNPPRKVMILAHIGSPLGEADKVNDVDAYHVRHSDGTRAVVKSSQLLPRNNSVPRSGRKGD